MNLVSRIYGGGLALGEEIEVFLRGHRVVCEALDVEDRPERSQVLHGLMLWPYRRLCPNKAIVPDRHSSDDGSETFNIADRFVRSSGIFVSHHPPFCSTVQGAYIF